MKILSTLLTKLILLGSVILAILLAVVVTVIFNNQNKKIYLYVSMKSSVSAVAQIYYDIGKGLNEADSYTLQVIKGNDFFTLQFLLPTTPIRYLRFDPLNKAGYVVLNEIKIINSDNQLIQKINLRAVQPLNQINQMKIENNVLVVATTQAANDPMLFLPFSYPIMGNTHLSKVITTLIVKLIIIFIILSGLFFIMFQGSYRVNIKLKVLQMVTIPNFYLGVKRKVTNLLLFLVSLSISVIIANNIYGYIKNPLKTISYRGIMNDYFLAFYNTKGQKITALNGTLKLVTDPFTIYSNYPHQKSTSYSIDSYGFREGYVNEKSNQLAIILGGSAAFGQGLPDNNQTFASKISRHNQKYKVLNSAVVGFLSGQELSQMIHYLDNFNPSLYIVFDGWNDIFDPYMYAQNWPVKYGPIGFNNTFFMIEERLATYYLQTADTREEKNEDILLPSLGDTLDEAKYFHKIQKQYLSNLEKMNAFSKARGVKFLLIFQPELGNKKIMSSTEKKLLTNWDNTYQYLHKNIPKKYHQLLTEAKKFCQQQNITFIDINEESAFSENSQTLFYDVVHPNELGHEIIAKIINEVLLDKF